jgi:hypothetical protein
MNNKAFFAIWIFVAAIIAAQPVGINFTIDVAEIPDSENPDWFIRAQCWNNGDGTFKIIIAPESINDPQINRIVAHEIGHVNNWDATEEEVDNFANKVVNDGSEPIHDATY